MDNIKCFEVDCPNTLTKDRYSGSKHTWIEESSRDRYGDYHTVYLCSPKCHKFFKISEKIHREHDC